MTEGLRARGTERQVTALAIGLAAGFVGLTLASLLLPDTARLGAWLPLHLLLAGAASTAIAGVMPFFSAAVSGAPPAPAAVRLLAVAAVAGGALVIAAGRLLSPPLTGADPPLAGLGGLVYLVGLIAVATATLLPLRSALGPRRFVMGTIYGVAILNAVIGAALGTLLLLGWSEIAGGWAALKPAHAWLNVFGFVSLAIAGSLLHLLPTVAGARISRTRSSIVCFAAVASGPLVAAIGFAITSQPLAVLGAAVLVVGALALAIHGANVLRARATWTTDPDWHRFATWSLVAGIGWFVVGTVIAATSVVAGWSTHEAWQLAPLVAPIGIGWVGQVLVGAWSHLLPAVGPGSPERHAGQRRALGLGGTVRLALVNGGVAAMVVAGFVPELGVLFAVGLVGAALAGVAAVALIGRALLLPDPRVPGSVVGASGGLLA